MIDYELAKELKEAGFPQHTNAQPGDWKSTMHFGFVTNPTLSELIKACGDGFSHLRRDYDEIPMGARGTWLACHSPDRGETEDCTVGKTPEEAVALLWLELNKDET